MAALQGNPNNEEFADLLIVQVSENWDDDFEFQVEKRKMVTATAKSEATKNWDNDFEDSHQSPKKIIQRHRKKCWDDKDDKDDDNENSELAFDSEVYEVVIAVTDFSMINDGIHKKFFNSINIITLMIGPGFSSIRDGNF